MTTDERLAEIRERHETIAALENEIPLMTKYQGNRDECGEALWRLPAHAAITLCELRNAVPKLLADIDTLLAAIADRDAVIAETLRRIEFENKGDKHVDVAQAVMDYVAEMCKQEREQIVAWLKERADEQEDRNDDIAIRNAAYALARGEGGA